MQINEIVKEVHWMAKKKGWWDDGGRSPLELHMLMVSEIAEATECVRRNKPDCYIELKPRSVGEASPGIHEIDPKNPRVESANASILMAEVSDFPKAEGEAVELMDCVIRIMDYFGHKEWNFDEILKWKIDYNSTRSYRHGGRKY